MAESMKLVALDWVRGEIEETLNQTQEALEAYIENREDVTRLQFCVTYLHQVVGTLKMIEAHGASLLAQELESLSQTLLDKGVEREDDAIEVLLRGVLQLPQYLARIFAGGRDMAVVLLPLLNDIRAVKNEALLTESSLFTPDIAAGQEELKKESDASKEDFSSTTLRKIRQLYEIALLGIIKDTDLDKNIQYVTIAVTKLSNMTVGAPTGTLWWVAQALADALANKGVECSKAVKMLLTKLNKLMRELLQNDVSSVPAPEDLFKNMLFYIAKSTESTARIESVRQAFRLEDTVFSEKDVEDARDQMSSPDHSAVESVVGVLLEQIAGIKDSLDAFVIGKVDDVTQLTPVAESLKQISDTLAVVGVVEVRNAIGEQAEILQNAVNSASMPDTPTLTNVAGAVLDAENTLQQLLSKGLDFASEGAERLSEPQELVLKESRATLESVKESFNTYVKSYLNLECIADTPAKVKEVMGALTVMNENRASLILGQSCEYIEKELIEKKKKPEAKELEALADAISAVEYYLEQLALKGSGDVLLLEVGEERVQAIGYEVPGSVGSFGEIKG